MNVRLLTNASIKAYYVKTKTLKESCYFDCSFYLAFNFEPIESFLTIPKLSFTGRAFNITNVVTRSQVYNS